MSNLDAYFLFFSLCARGLLFSISSMRKCYVAAQHATICFIGDGERGNAGFRVGIDLTYRAGTVSGRAFGFSLVLMAWRPSLGCLL